jgi:hypothetical protein
MRHVGYCVGGENHGKEVEGYGDFHRMPIIGEVSAIPDYSVTMETMTQEASYEEYQWWTMIFKSGKRVSFWKHTSIKSKEELFALLIRLEMER